jgi:hypothetical protein
MTVNIKITACWDTAPCSIVEVDQRFRGVYCFHLQVITECTSERWSASMRLHVAVSQKAVTFKVLAKNNQINDTLLR